jgi:hypothetical protein
MERRARGVKVEDYTRGGEPVVVITDRHGEERWRGTLPPGVDQREFIELLWQLLDFVDPDPTAADSGLLLRVLGPGEIGPGRSLPNGAWLALLR